MIETGRKDTKARERDRGAKMKDVFCACILKIDVITYFKK